MRPDLYSGSWPLQDIIFLLVRHNLKAAKILNCFSFKQNEMDFLKRSNLLPEGKNATTMRYESYSNGVFKVELATFTSSPEMASTYNW
jgi:hypothetical protein